MLRFRTYAIVAAVVVLNAAAWAISLSTFPDAGLLPARHVAAEFLSSTAIIIMCANLLLATRLRPFESLFGGLDKLFTAHRFDGLAVATIIFCHFLLMPESPGWVPSKLIGYPNVTLVIASVMLAIAPRSPWRRFVTLRYQDWKLEHRFMGVFVAAAVVHSVVAHAIILALPLMRVWVYGVAALGLAAYAYRELVERFVAERHRYRVTEPRHASGDVTEIPLEPVAHPIAHRAGQFAFVRFENGPSREQHPFTISMAPCDGHLRFSVKASGDYTRALQTHLAAGSLARIEGPYGRFESSRGGVRQLWLAGGIGITPFLAFLGDVNPEHDLRLVWIVHDESDVFYRDEIDRAVAENPNVHADIHVTSVSGRLRLADLDLADPGELSVYICGPVPMRDAFVGQLLELGVRRGRIFYEEFSLR